MIKEEELREAIAECQGQRNPNANTCMKLASYLTILDHMTEPTYTEKPSYSFAAPPFTSDTEFGRKVQDKDVNEVLSVMDELMETLRILNPRLYDGVLSRL